MMQSTFFRKEAYEAVGGLDRTLTFIMDLDLYTRLAKRQPFARIPQLLAGFRIHDACKSVNIQHIRKMEQEAFLERHGVKELSRFLRDLFYWRFRVPSLIRKSGLRLQQVIGRVKKPGQFDARIWADRHRK